MYGVDIKVSREFGQLPGGPIGVAVGAEVRREQNDLPLYTGLGDYHGLSLRPTAASATSSRPTPKCCCRCSKQLELNGALRYDHYSDAGNSLTPKVGAKYKALSNLALRGTYAQGFRAPSSTENSAGSLAAFGGATVDDKLVAQR